MHNKPDISAFIRSFQSVPTSQKVLIKLLGVLDDEGCHLEEISDVIRLDPGLATLVLRLSNSAYFGMQVPSDSLDQAITRLGSYEVFKLVALIALNDMARDGLKVYDVTPDQMLKLSVSAGMVTEWFSDRLDLDRHVGYTVGLLHCIGMWMISRCLDEYGFKAQAPDSDVFDWTHWERDVLGTDRGEVASIMMARWGFPSSLIYPVQFHIHPFEAPDQVRLACILRVAANIAACIAIPDRNKLEEMSLPPMVMKISRLKPQDIEDVVPEAMTHARRIGSMLGK